MPALWRLTSLSSSMPNEALPKATHHAGKSPCCASWLRGPAVAACQPRTRSQTSTVSPPSVDSSFRERSVFLGRRCNASALSCADQLLTLTFISENGYKFHANGHTGSALGTQRLMVEESQRIIIAQHQETLRIDSER
jgi:hypothetical protein